MSRVAAPPSLEERRRRLHLAVLLGVVLALPRFVVAWLVLPPAFDLLLIAVTLSLVAGMVVLAASLARLWLLRSPRVLPVAITGLAVLLIAGLVVRIWPPVGAAVAFEGGLFAPPSVALYLMLYLMLGALSQFGLFLLIGSAGLAITRTRTARAAR